MTETLADLVGHADKIAELNAALAAAQAEYPPLPRDKEVSTGSYTFRYADLGTIFALHRPVLAKHGLSVTQPLVDGAIMTELRHAAGGVISTRFPFPTVPQSPQQLGSLITYLRRYCLCSMLGIASDDDTDAPDLADKPRPEEVKLVTRAQHAKIAAMIKALDEGHAPPPAEYASADGWVEVLKQALEHRYEVESRKDLTAQQASDLIDWLDEQSIPF